MEGGFHVSITLFEENVHLTKISLKAFKEGSLSDNEMILLSEHICICESCAEELASCFDDSELAEAPVGFEQEIMCKIKNQKDKNTHFIFYSLRVAMAASIALMFVFSNGLNFLANTKGKILNVNPMSLRTINTINESLNDFSQKIINFEVFNNETGKK